MIIYITLAFYATIACCIAYGFDFDPNDRVWPVVMCMLWPLCMLFLIMMRVIEGVDHEG